MEIEDLIKQLVANAESKVSFKIETNSRGSNVTTHVYQGATDRDIADTWKKAKEAHNKAVTEMNTNK